jgi:MFS family permease
VTATAPAPPAARAHRGPFAGWYVVAAVFVMLMTSAGLGFYGLSVYLEAVTTEKGFQTGPASLGSSLFFIVSGITGRIIGPLIARRDIRIVVCFGAVVGGLALASLGQVTELWQFYAVYAVFAVGFACTAIVPGTTLVTRWFHKKRSVALSIASTGLSVGGLTLTKAAATLIDSEGLESATPWLGLAYVMLIVPVAVFFMWPDPGRRGLLPDGEPPTPGGKMAVVLGAAYEQAVRSRFFLFVTAGFVLIMGAQVGGINQLVKLGAERVDASTGALAVSLLALSSVVARLVGGVIASKVPMDRMTVGLAVVQGFALGVLAFAGARVGLLGGAILFGLTVGNLLMLQPLLLAEAFGVRDYPRLFGLNQLVVTVGIALGPFVLGSLHDVFDGYEVPYVVAGIMSVGGAVLVAMAGRIETVHRELW